MTQRKTRRPPRASLATRRIPATPRERKLRSRVTIIFLLYVLAATGVATVAAQALHSRGHHHAARHHIARAHVDTRPPTHLVLMVLDGARPDYLNIGHLPHLEALRNRGTIFSDSMDGILESETPSGHTTLSTGSTPAHNGILGFNWKQNDDDYSLFSPAMVRAGVMEQIMRRAHVPTIAGLYKGRFPHAKVVALSGHKYYAADPLGGPDADAIMYYQGDYRGHVVPVGIPGHMPPSGVLDAPSLVGKNNHLPSGQEDHLATELALTTFAHMHQRITLINYPEFDWPLGHVQGGDESPRKVRMVMQSFDRDLGLIEDTYRKAGILKRTLFVITADHGMEPIKRFVPQTEINNAVALAGTTAPAIAFNTGVYVWLKDTHKSQAVADNIMAMGDPGIQSAYYLSTGKHPHYVQAHGSSVSGSLEAANQYLLRTLMNGHQPSVVAFCKAGQTTSSPKTSWRADHGGGTWQSQHIPLLIAGPGIQRGMAITVPAQLEDIAPTVLTDMGVKPKGMEGSILADAMLRPARAALTARQTEITRLTPVVNALVAQDSVDSITR